MPRRPKTKTTRFTLMPRFGGPIKFKLPGGKVVMGFSRGTSPAAYDVMKIRRK